MNEEKMTAGAGRGPCESAPQNAQNAGIQPGSTTQTSCEDCGGVSGQDRGKDPVGSHGQEPDTTSTEISGQEPGITSHETPERISDGAKMPIYAAQATAYMEGKPASAQVAGTSADAVYASAPAAKPESGSALLDVLADAVYGSAPKPKPQFGFAPLDILAAAVFFAVGWLFWEWQFWGWQLWDGWMPFSSLGTALFTVLYAVVVLGYVYAAGRRPARESWFWLAVLLGLGLVYALPYGGGLLGALHYGMLLLVAVYWTLCAAGRLEKGQTSNWLAFDVFSAAFILPWGNFMRLLAALLCGLKQLRARLRAARKNRSGRGGRQIWGVLGGIAAAGVCLCAVLPSLMAADDGFAAVMHTMGSMLNSALFDWDISPEIFLKLFFAVPTAQFLYGLAYGAVRGRRLGWYDQKEVCSMQRGARFAPRATVLTALAALCAVYLLFLSMQAKYLFGAFWGALPEGFSYSEYARQGFFELCRVAAINIVILLCANIFSRQQAGENRYLRLGNIALSVLTLLLLVTAASKMGLYIVVQGLTVKRVLVSVFLVWMAVVFVCIIVRQFRPVQLVRISVLVGAVLFTALCVLPVEDGIVAYNTAFVPDAAAFGIPAAPESAADGEIEIVDTGECAALVWQGRTYVPYGPVENAAMGRRIGGSADGDVKEDYYTCKGYSEQEWIIAMPRSGLMDSPMLYREQSVWDIPEGLESEYAWNQPDAAQGT